MVEGWEVFVELFLQFAVRLCAPFLLLSFFLSSCVGPGVGLGVFVNVFALSMSMYPLTPDGEVFYVVNELKVITVF